MEDAKAGTWKDPNLVGMESGLGGVGAQGSSFSSSPGPPPPSSSCSFGASHGVPCVLEPDLQELPGEAD